MFVVDSPNYPLPDGTIVNPTGGNEVREASPEPPESLSGAIVSFDRTVRHDCPSWFMSRGLLVDLDRWNRLAMDSDNFWGFADDYLNELGSRERLVLWMERSDGEVRRWLVSEVDRIDDVFRSKSVPCAPAALTDDLSEPSAWWRRRLTPRPRLEDVRDVRGSLVALRAASVVAKCSGAVAFRT